MRTQATTSSTRQATYLAFPCKTQSNHPRAAHVEISIRLEAHPHRADRIESMTPPPGHVRLRVEPSPPVTAAPIPGGKGGRGGEGGLGGGEEGGLGGLGGAGGDGDGGGGA